MAAGEFLSLLGMLAAVSAILVLAYLFTRHVAGRGLGAFLPRGELQRMRILDQLPLGREQRLAVVQVGERVFLLGLTTAGITHLAELSAEEAALWQAGENAAASAPPSFKEAFLQQLRKKTQGR